MSSAPGAQLGETILVAVVVVGNVVTASSKAKSRQRFWSAMPKMVFACSSKLQSASGTWPQCALPGQIGARAEFSHSQHATVFMPGVARLTLHWAVARVSHPNPAVNKAASAGDSVVSAVMFALPAMNGSRSPSMSRSTAATLEANTATAPMQANIPDTHGILYMLCVFLRIWERGGGRKRL